MASPSATPHSVIEQAKNELSSSFLAFRAPAKHPAPEQLPSPVMFSYQGRGRPRKNWTHATVSIFVLDSPWFKETPFQALLSSPPISLSCNALYSFLLLFMNTTTQFCHFIIFVIVNKSVCS